LVVRNERQRSDNSLPAVGAFCFRQADLKADSSAGGTSLKKGLGMLMKRLGFAREEQEIAGPYWVSGFGLTAMKERTKALGGKLLVETEPRLDTKITTVLPLSKKGK
jgi:hypothetical protein